MLIWNLQEYGSLLYRGKFLPFYDLSIYCDDGFFYKSAYKTDRVFAYLEIFALYTPSNPIYDWLTPPKSLTNWLNGMKILD